MLRLNVGGIVYTTTKSTLIGDGTNYFSALLGGSFAATKDEDGNIFIDRDGAPFEAILTFLRTNKLISIPSVPREAIEAEAEFYQISGLIALFQDEKDKLKMKKEPELKKGYYGFGFNPDMTVDEKECDIFNKANNGSYAPFLLEFDLKSEKCMMGIGRAAPQNLEMMHHFSKAPDLWGEKGADKYGKIVVSLVIRGKYWIANKKEIKILISMQPEKYFFGMVSDESLILSLANSTQIFHEGNFLERGFVEVKRIPGSVGHYGLEADS